MEEEDAKIRKIWAWKTQAMKFWLIKEKLLWIPKTQEFELPGWMSFLKMVPRVWDVEKQIGLQIKPMPKNLRPIKICVGPSMIS